MVARSAPLPSAPMGRLEGKVAVVTGGGNGIGRAAAVRFADEGADVVIADLLEEAGKEAVAAVEAMGRRAIFVACDVSREADIDVVMQAAVDELGGLDVLMTCAGISNAGYRSGEDIAASVEVSRRRNEADADLASVFLETTHESWDEVLEVNLTGTFLAIQSAARHMAARGTGGSIITIASIAAKHPEVGGLAYCVSKAGVWMLTKHAARSLAGIGIRVNAIGPGFIDTNMTAVLKTVPGVEDRFLAKVPMNRMGRPAEIAATAAFLASEDASYTTGEMFHVDGGFYTE